MELVVQLFENHPIPTNIYTPDGLCVYANRASVKMVDSPDAYKMVGNYVMRYDQNCLDIFGQEVMDRIFRGEHVFIKDFPAPISSTLAYGYIDKKPWKAATMDMELLPLWDGDTFVYTVCFFYVKYVYPGRAEIRMAQKYIEEHWRDELDWEKVAHYVSMSSRHLRRVFIEDTGITPVEFYQRVKIAKLQEKLFDGNLSIEQAFEACGVVYRGAYYDLFKEKVGMTPAEYRNKHNIT